MLRFLLSVLFALVWFAPALAYEYPFKNPYEATVLGTLLAGVATILACTVVIGLVPTEILKDSGAPMAEAASRVWGPGAAIASGANADYWTTHSGSTAGIERDGLGVRAQAQVSGSANIVEGSAHFTSDGVTVDAQGAVGVSGSASAGASLGADGLSAEVHGEVFDGARGGVDASADLGVVKATGHGEASVGLEASGQGNVHVGGDGVMASAEGKAFAGVEAGVEGSMEVGGVTGTAGASGMVGIGVEGSVKGSLSADKVGVSVDAGVAIGLGGSVHLEVSVNPSEIVKNVTKAVSSWLKF